MKNVLLALMSCIYCIAHVQDFFDAPVLPLLLFQTYSFSSPSPPPLLILFQTSFSLPCSRPPDAPSPDLLLLALFQTSSSLSCYRPPPPCPVPDFLLLFICSRPPPPFPFPELFLLAFSKPTPPCPVPDLPLLALFQTSSSLSCSRPPPP